MRCEEIITREPATVTPNDNGRLAAEKMREANVGFLPVCKTDGTVVGVLTDRDLALRLVGEGRPVTTKVRELMTKEDLATCSPEDDLEDAARIMRDRGVGRVLVIDDQNHLVGIVSLADVVRFTGDEDSISTMRDVTEREASPTP